ncbi:MAG: GntR family transcriptional regulator [Marinovum algicola]|jgi:GntR family transcriptional repressor for pyruvate dehydrogenase complex|uniref:Transcriptional regulator, GntR family n=1 Tax=Marinovum algicola TaxID=42444 RepID=A0A975WDJ3_9RHOB|nr:MULTISPECIES: GntR family transcriptional regulator [Marinovum]MDD9739598.1 GntR family transcriptional regulator [Marinovum sp. SP66]MDD9745377.1 GntR family transcriptional regulator [Marinovum sp. PR37]SEK01647.1 transcriptional regulator, GntR family [Marinovum algicola]SLN43976.1 HTH-type transcriptional regulator LutR [Marinovum algicola]
MKKTERNQRSDLPAQIAKALRDAILSGELTADDRLPSESDLAETFEVSRPTVREALKRLAAQSLIRTERGAFGGAFVRRLSYDEAQAQHASTSTLLLSINEVDFAVACEARYALETSVTALACARRSADDLAAMREEIARQGRGGLSDEEFCASDVALHRRLVDAAGNPILSYQLAGAVEAMQPLMNMITFSARSREEIITLHTRLTDAVEAGVPEAANATLAALERYTLELGQGVIALRARRSRPETG